MWRVVAGPDRPLEIYPSGSGTGTYSGGQWKPALVLLYMIAFWAIFTGILEVVASISLRREIENEWLMILGGVISVLFGVILAVLPGAGLLSLVWLTGIYALIFGVAFVVLGFRVRGHRTSSRVR